MELLQEGILHLEKQLKGIAFDLNMAKAMNMVLRFIVIALVAAYGGSLVCSIAMQSIEVSIAIYIITCSVIGFLWIALFDVIDHNNYVIDKLKSEKFKCETEIENYKQQISNIREEEKKLNMKPKTVLTENQLKTLINYSEKAKQIYKWLVVTENGEVVASDLKPDYDEEFDVWFFNCEAKTIQVGSNKKLAKHSKHTLTRIV